MNGASRHRSPDIKSLFGASLFWDAGVIDPVGHAHYVIARVLDFGDAEMVRLLRRIYRTSDISAVLRTRRGLSARTGKFWAVKLNIPLEEVACLSKYYPRQV